MDTTVLYLEATVSGALPVFTFALKRTGEGRSPEDGEETEYTYQVNISCAESPELISQSFSVASCEALTGDMISFVDIDCDGYLDMEIIYCGAGTVNRTFRYYRWNIFEGDHYGQYEETAFFSMLGDYIVYPDTKQIVASSRSGASVHVLSLYQLTGAANGGWLGRYEWVRGAELTVSGTGSTWRVYDLDDEIYNAKIKQDDSCDTGNSYLRFGVSEAISADEAHSVLVEKLGAETAAGQEDGSLEYQTAYVFEEMVLIDGVSCYSFRMSWLVDDVHWSYVDNVFVAPDGTILLSDGQTFSPR